MSATPREYLVDRFASDAIVLRERVALLARGTTVPGPDLATSRRMAAACDEVADMLRAIAETGDATTELDALGALIPLLEARAAAQQGTPAVRSVYAGAATRIREVRDAEARAAEAHALDGADDDAIPDEALDDDAVDDEEVDDDDLADDDHPTDRA
jgi:hypothetical protein